MGEATLFGGEGFGGHSTGLDRATTRAMHWHRDRPLDTENMMSVTCRECRMSLPWRKRRTLDEPGPDWCETVTSDGRVFYLCPICDSPWLIVDPTPNVQMEPRVQTELWARRSGTA